MVHLFRLRNSLHGQNKLSVFLQSFNSHGAASGYPPATLSVQSEDVNFIQHPTFLLRSMCIYTLNEYLDLPQNLWQQWSGLDAMCVIVDSK